MRRAALVAALAAVPAWGSDIPIRYADIARTGDLICEFIQSGPRSARRGPDVLMIFDGLATGSGIGRVVSSRRAGAREVRMYSGETGLHLVEDVNDSVVVTSLISCDARQGTSSRCVRYSAINAWHFDRKVHLDPDGAFRRLPGTSYAGHCEAWHMGERRPEFRPKLPAP